MILGELYSECAEGGGLAVYPSWMFMVIAGFCCIIVFAEYKCLTYAIIPFTQVVGMRSMRLPVVGWSVPFMCWWACYTLKTVARVVDISMDSLSVTKLLKATTCEGQQLTAIWAHVSNNSTVSPILSLVS